MISTEFKQQKFTVLGVNNQLEGEFKFYGDTIIRCQIKGTLSLLDDGKVTLERNSFFEGTIYCKDLEIFGEFSGTIIASGSLVIRSSGKVSGNIQAEKMSIYPGATLNIEGHTQQ